MPASFEQRGTERKSNFREGGGGRERRRQSRVHRRLKEEARSTVSSLFEGKTKRKGVNNEKKGKREKKTTRIIFTI